MLKVTKNRTGTISNKLAAIAALLLVISTLSGVDESVNLETQPASQLSGAQAETDNFNHSGSGGAETSSKKKGFKISLYLYPHS